MTSPKSDVELLSICDVMLESRWVKERPDAATVARALRSRITAETGDRAWKPIDDYARRGQRLVLCWDDSKTLPPHWETGRYKNGVGKDSGWCNTYGHPFSGAPTHYMEPLPPAPKGE